MAERGRIAGIMTDINFFKGKKVFITGHTGFKGSWLSLILADAGAIVTGYALKPPTEPNLFTICGIERMLKSVIADIRDKETLLKKFKEFRPEIVIHMAAQPIVLDGYENPAYTYETNVMGTVNILECVRLTDSVKSFLNVTTDKVYKNNEWDWGYRETDILDGYDPYSNSKSCSELVTACYARSFFNSKIPVSTARAGNVIGGGDFSRNRIMADCIAAAIKGVPIAVRNPNSTRPYQHVIEPLFAYLTIISRQYENRELVGNYNIGPDDKDCVTTGKLVELFCKYWGNSQIWTNIDSKNPHEANFLKLDCSQFKNKFGWQPRWDIETAVEKSVEWTKSYLSNESMPEVMRSQIKAYVNNIIMRAESFSEIERKI
jgi:CDP-glucose 4,6-dehydratase